VTFSTGSAGLYKESENFFAQFAIDPKTALDVFTSASWPGKQGGVLRRLGNSCIVGQEARRPFRFKIAT